MSKDTPSSDSGKNWLQFWGVAITALATIIVAYITYRGTHTDPSKTQPNPDPQPVANQQVAKSHPPTTLFDSDSPYPRILGSNVQIGSSKDQFLAAESNAKKINSTQYDFKPSDQSTFSRISIYLDVNQNISEIYCYFPIGNMHKVNSQATTSLGSPNAAPGSDYPAEWSINNLAIQLNVDTYNNCYYLITAEGS